MKIYSILGVEIADVPVQSNAEHERELMKSDFIRLEWSQSSLLELPCGSYIKYNGVNYRLLKDYKPEQQSTQQWDYSPEFQHPIMMLGTIPFINVTGDTSSWESADKETEWNWTGMAIKLVQEKFIPFLNKYGVDNKDIGTGWTAVVNSNLKASETCSFQSMDFLSALSHAAQQFECEWHLDYENKILYFGHINITTSELVFEVGDNIDKPTIRENNEGYYNAYIAKGSTRNISQVNDKGENIQVNKRLKLNPEKYPDGYIDRRKSDKEPLVMKELIYDDIYPSLDLYIYNPRARTRFLLDSNTGKRIEDKKDPTGYKRYSIWYVRLAYQINGEWKDFNFSKDMLIGNLSCQFQGNETSTKYTSPLVGREFELKYHESDYVIPADPVNEDTGIEIKKGDYEIVYDESSGLIIPTTIEGGMYPLGDKEPSEQNNILRLYNIALPSEYVSKAQEELEKQALEDIVYWESDRNNYEFNSNPVAFKADMPELFIGRGVVYKNGTYTFKTRISKLVQKIDFPYEVEITVGNEEIKGTTTTMREQLQMVVSAMNNGMGGMSVEQFKKMLNIYATQMFNGRYLSKLNPDTASGIITFLQGLVSQGAITAKDKIILGEYVESALWDGKGGCLDKDGNAWLRNLTLAESLTVPKLSYNMVEICPGIKWQSAGGGTIKEVEVEKLADGSQTINGTITLDLKEGEIGQIAVGDLCMAVFHSIAMPDINAKEDFDSGTGTMTRAGFYTCYFRITDILETQYNSKARYVLRNDDIWPYRHHPSAQMIFVAFGNPEREERQQSCYQTTTYTRYLSNVTTWEFEAYNIAMQLGDLSNLSVFGYNLQGYSAFLNNAYITGHIEQIRDLRTYIHISGLEDSHIEVGGSRVVSMWLERDNHNYHDAEWAITRESGLPEADAEWNEAHKSVSSPLTLTSEDMGEGAYLQAVMFTFTGRKTITDDVTGNPISFEGSTSAMLTLISREDMWIDFTCEKGKTFSVLYNDVDIKVTAHLMYGNTDITNNILLRSSSTMKWKRDSEIPSADLVWTPTTDAKGNTLHIVDKPDVRHDCGDNWATSLRVTFIFECTVIFGAEIIPLSGEVTIG